MSHVVPGTPYLSPLTQQEHLKIPNESITMIIIMPMGGYLKIWQGPVEKIAQHKSIQIFYLYK